MDCEVDDSQAEGPLLEAGGVEKQCLIGLQRLVPGNHKEMRLDLLAFGIEGRECERLLGRSEVPRGGEVVVEETPCI